MGSASLPGRHVMANALRGELHVMGGVILQPTTGNVLILEDVSENFINAMENVQLEALHAGTEFASVIMIQTAMVTGIIEDVEIPVYTNRNLVKIHVLLVTTSANTSIDMEAMIDAFPSTTFKEVITCMYCGGQDCDQCTSRYYFSLCPAHQNSTCPDIFTTPLISTQTSTPCTCPTTSPAQPTTAGPTTAGPTTAGPTTAGPTTAGPTTAGPTTAAPTTAAVTTAGPPPKVKRIRNKVFI